MSKGLVAGCLLSSQEAGLAFVSVCVLSVALPWDRLPAVSGDDLFNSPLTGQFFPTETKQMHKSDSLNFSDLQVEAVFY